MTGALVSKILLEKASDGDNATKLRFTMKGSAEFNAPGARCSMDGEDVDVYASKEVLLCAGSFGLPQILELSRTGNPAVLSKYSIDTVIEYHGVGENPQDHPCVLIGYPVAPGVPTMDDLADSAATDAVYGEYIANFTGPLATTVASSALLTLGQIDDTSVDLSKNRPGNFKGDCTPSTCLQHRLQLISLYSEAAGLTPEAVTQELIVHGGMSPQFVNDTTTTKLFYASSPGNFSPCMESLSIRSRKAQCTFSPQTSRTIQQLS